MGSATILRAATCASVPQASAGWTVRRTSMIALPVSTPVSEPQGENTHRERREVCSEGMHLTLTSVDQTLVF